MKHLCYIFFLMAAGLTNLNAQIFEALPSKDRILIGEPFDLKLEARVDANSSFQWPQFQVDTLKEFEILEIGKLDTTLENNIWILTQNLQLTSFDSGFFVTPPLQLIAGLDTLNTDPILVQVGMPEITADVPMYDIKDLQAAPIDWIRVLWILFFVFVGLLAIYMIYRTYHIKKQNIRYQTVTPKVPPHETALTALQALQEKALWEREAFKLHYDELTHIFKVYLASRYNIATLELTSSELLQKLRARGLTHHFGSGIEQVLFAADMAKFAKGRTDTVTAQTLLELVRDYVLFTREQPENPQQNV